MSGGDHEARLVALETDNSWVKKTLDEIRASTAAIAESLAQLTRIEADTRRIDDGVRRNWQAIEEECEARREADESIEERLLPLEAQAPKQKLTSDLVMEAVKWLAVLGLGAIMGQVLL